MYIDQQTDPGKRALYKFLGNYSHGEDKETLRKVAFDANSLNNASETSFACTRHRKFPVNTRENTMLSKVYFDAQKGSMEKEAAETIGKTLDVHLALHNIDTSIFTGIKVAGEAQVKVKALAHPVEMLPEYNFCKVATEEDLPVAEKLFNQGVDSLQLADRVTFAQNFIKAAEELGASVTSEEILKYAGMLDFDVVHTRHALELRSGLAYRKGKQTHGFRKLACALESFAGKPSRAELQKLAQVISTLDVAAGITEEDYRRFIDSPFGAVFVKSAVEAADASAAEVNQVEGMAKSDIIGKYGEGVLEIVEMPDGTIDYEALKDVIKMEKGLVNA